MGRRGRSRANTKAKPSALTAPAAPSSGSPAWLGELAPRTPPKRRRQRQDHSGHHRWVQRFHVVKAGPPPLSASPVEPYGAKEQVGAEQPRCSSKAGWRLSHVSPWSDSQRRV